MQRFFARINVERKPRKIGLHRFTGITAIKMENWNLC